MSDIQHAIYLNLFQINLLTLFILMDYSIHIDTIGMELSILYFNGLLVNFSNDVFLSRKTVFISLATIADPDEIPPNAAFYIHSYSLHCLPKYLFASIQNEKG